MHTSSTSTNHTEWGSWEGLRLEGVLDARTPNVLQFPVLPSHAHLLPNHSPPYQQGFKENVFFNANPSPPLNILRHNIHREVGDGAYLLTTR